MPFKDIAKQRQAVRKIMEKRYLFYNGLDRGKPFYTWLRRRKGKIVELGTTQEDLSTLEKLEAWLLRGSKLGISPHEVWYCYPFWLLESEPFKPEEKLSTPLTDAVAKIADLPLPSEIDSPKRKKKRKNE